MSEPIQPIGVVICPNKLPRCLTRHWETGGIVDICILKWDAYERMKRVEAAYAAIRKDGVVGDMIESGAGTEAIPNRGSRALKKARILSIFLSFYFHVHFWDKKTFWLRAQIH